MKEKTDKSSSVKKPIYRKWWFWVVIVVLLAGIIGNSEDSSGSATPATSPVSDTVDASAAPDASATPAPTEPVPEDISSEAEKLPVEAETVSRALTTLFVKNVLGEKWHMLSFSVESYALDEDGNGTIEVLYLPPDAGNGETKVNLTIEKSGSTYTTTYALLAGLYEVDMGTVPVTDKVLTY